MFKLEWRSGMGVRRHVCPSVFPHATTPLPLRFDTRVFSGNVWRKFKFHWNLTL
jgi:hypothetical protein